MKEELDKIDELLTRMTNIINKLSTTIKTEEKKNAEK